MTTKQEMVMTLFTNETIEKVKKQFDKVDDVIVHHESFNINFRLFKCKKNINLELMVQILFDTEEKRSFGNISGKIQNSITFFKPIGFFTKKRWFFSSKIEVTIVKEFEDELDFLIKLNKIPSNLYVNKLSLKENAVLSAFSVEALIKALNYEDSSFFANGLFCDISMTFEGFPQVFLDDRHGLDGPIAAYFPNGEDSVNPIIEYKKIYDKFHSMSLMTIFKNL